MFPASRNRRFHSTIQPVARPLSGERHRQRDDLDLEPLHALPARETRCENDVDAVAGGHRQMSHGRMRSPASVRPSWRSRSLRCGRVGSPTMRAPFDADAARQKARLRVARTVRLENAPAHAPVASVTVSERDLGIDRQPRAHVAAGRTCVATAASNRVARADRPLAADARIRPPAVPAERDRAASPTLVERLVEMDARTLRPDPRPSSPSSAMTRAGRC